MKEVLNLGPQLSEVTFKQLCNGKISVAIQAMIDGLEKQSQRPDFRVDMLSYSYTSNRLCFGCAATCAVMELTKTDLDITNINTHRDIRLWPLIPVDEVIRFEFIMNQVRLNGFKYLFDSFGYPNWWQRIILMIMGYTFIGGTRLTKNIRLDNYNWKERLPEFQKLADAFRKVGR